MNPRRIRPILVRQLRSTRRRHRKGLTIRTDYISERQARLIVDDALERPEATGPIAALNVALDIIEGDLDLPPIRRADAAYRRMRT